MAPESTRQTPESAAPPPGPCRTPPSRSDTQFDTRRAVTRRLFSDGELDVPRGMLTPAEHLLIVPIVNRRTDRQICGAAGIASPETLRAQIGGIVRKLRTIDGVVGKARIRLFATSPEGQAHLQSPYYSTLAFLEKQKRILMSRSTRRGAATGPAATSDPPDRKSA